MARLRYVTDRQAGVRRLKSGKGFRYVGTNGQAVRGEQILARIRGLAIPPAWTNVWICADSRGHLQATGRDAKGRKQYRYHPDWRATRDDTKFYRMQAFARAVPVIRRRARADLARPGLPREKVLATLVHLLERSLIRVGNEEYAPERLVRTDHDARQARAGERQHRSLSVPRQERQASHIDVDDWHLARIVKQCRDLPGQELFQYVDAAGRRRSIGSGDLNDDLRDITVEEFTSKDFRTWWDTVLAVKSLRELPPGRTRTHSEKNVLLAMDAVAGLLGNTRAVCRKSYVHPGVIDCYVDGSLAGILERRLKAAGRAPAGLRPDEAAVVTILKHLPHKEPGNSRAA